MSSIIVYDHVQGSPDWHKARKKFPITASMIGAILSCKENSKQWNLMVQEKACGYSFTDLSDVPAIKHGVKFEAKALERLKERYPTIVQCGLVHNTKFPDIAISPDGLLKTTDGLYLIEIKCPYSREIKKQVPPNYWHQMQLQMLVCDAKACIYYECKFDPKTERFIKSWQTVVKRDEWWWADNELKIHRFQQAVKNFCWLDRFEPEPVNIKIEEDIEEHDDISQWNRYSPSNSVDS